MKNAIWALTILLSLLSSRSKSQYAIAGVPGSIYVDIIPDTTIVSVTNGQYVSYLIDINQDGIQDIKIQTYYSYTALHFQYWHKDVNVYSQNSSVSFFQGNYMDSTACQSHSSGTLTYTPRSTTLLKVFNFGDTIRDDITFSSGTLQYYNDQNPPIGNHCYDDWGLWTSLGDKYFGVKYNTGSDSTYGWVKVNVGFGSCKIEEFSLAVALVGIQENRTLTNSVKIFPNPASNRITISSEQLTENCEVKITDVLCNEVLPAYTISQRDSQINLSNLPNGIYFVSVKTTQGLTTQKLIVQH